MGIETWKIDSVRSAIRFSVRDVLAGEVRGEFMWWHGRVHVENDDLEKAKVVLSIDASSIDTGLYGRNERLTSEGFLDVAKYPHITFTSTKIEARPDGTWRVHGDLTVRGITRNIALDVERVGGENYYRATTVIDRRDFGLKLSRYFDGVMVGNLVTVTFDVDAVRPVVRNEGVLHL